MQLLFLLLFVIKFSIATAGTACDSVIRTPIHIPCPPEKNYFTEDKPFHRISVINEENDNNASNKTFHATSKLKRPQLKLQHSKSTELFQISAPLFTPKPPFQKSKTAPQFDANELLQDESNVTKSGSFRSLRWFWDKSTIPQNDARSGRRMSAALRSALNNITATNAWSLFDDASKLEQLTDKSDNETDFMSQTIPLERPRVVSQKSEQKSRRASFHTISRVKKQVNGTTVVSMKLRLVRELHASKRENDSIVG